MTAERGSIERDARWSRLLLLVPPALVLLVAALTPTAALHPDQSDVGLYLNDARAVLAGQVPYRDVSLEYPPGALIPMVVPYLAAFSSHVGIDAYKVLFAGWEAALLLALGLVVGNVAARIGVRHPIPRLIILTLCALLAITWRYDLFPALLTLVAVWAAIGRRPVLVGFALGLGVLAKLYPVALLPALALPWLFPFDLARLTRLGAAFGLTVLLGLLPFVTLAGDDAFHFLDYQVGRGLQIESIGGALVLLTGLVAGDPAQLSYRFGAIQVDGDLATGILGLLPVLTVAAFGVLAALGWRRVRDEAAAARAAGAAIEADEEDGGGVRPSTLATLALASLLVLIVTSKVYSIQYVVWLVPFLALLRGWQFWLGAAIAALTTPIHPILYTDLAHQQALPILVLNLRNALVVALTAWVVIDVARGRAGAPLPGAGRGSGAPGETRTHDL